MRADELRDDTRHEKVDKRHLAGFRKFQRAALKALGAAVGSIECAAREDGVKPGAGVKVSDMKSLVSAYRDAVTGERMVLGIEARAEGRPSGDWPDEMVIRWVEDDGQVPDGKELGAQ